MLRKITFVVLVYMVIDSNVEGSQDVIKNLSINYSKALEQCKTELGLDDSVYDDFRNFWKEDYVVTNRATGCAFHCLSSKLDLVAPDGSLHRGNAADFVKQHAVDDEIFKQLMDLIHKCEDENPDDDKCLRTMKLANCFKVEVHKLNWAPDIDVIVAEIITEA